MSDKVKELKPKNVVDAEVVSEELPAAIPPKTELTIGIGEAGNIYYRIAGTEQSLVAIEGLLKYARLEMDRLWEKAFTPQEK